jgi:hypothetical protein
MTDSRSRTATAWDADACVCGCPRTAHVPGKRPRWPLTGSIRGQCTTCGCTQWAIDVAALLAREEAVAAERRAQLLAMLADPYFGKRRPVATPIRPAVAADPDHVTEPLPARS